MSIEEGLLRKGLPSYSALLRHLTKSLLQSSLIDIFDADFGHSGYLARL